MSTSNPEPIHKPTQTYDLNNKPGNTALCGAKWILAADIDAKVTCPTCIEAIKNYQKSNEVK